MKAGDWVQVLRGPYPEYRGVFGDVTAVDAMHVWVRFPNMRFSLAFKEGELKKIGRLERV